MASILHNNLFNPDLVTYKSKHIKSLDGIRGLAIILVILFHCYKFLVVTRIGWIGVDLFFVLSGFLITGILVSTKRKKGYFKNFYVRRVLRIFPLYYLSLIIFLVVIPAIAPTVLNQTDELLQYQAWYWLYAQNILYLKLDGFLWSERDNILNHFWSLSVEEHFYLFWPLIVYFLSNKQIIRVAIVLIISSIVARTLVINSPTNWVVPYVFTLTRMDALLLGAILAVIFQEEKRLKWFQSNLKYIFFISITLIIGFLVITRQLSSFHVQSNSLGLFYTLLAFFFVSLVGISMSQTSNPVKRVFETKFLRVAGKYSYGLYVFHLPIYLLCIRYLFDHIHHVIQIKVISDITNATISVIITCVVCYLSYQLVEKRFLKLKTYFD